MADYTPVTPATSSKLADLWKQFTNTRIPLGDYEYGLGVTVNDVLQPVTDTRGGPELLPKDFSLAEVPGFLAHMAEGYDVKKMGQGIVDAIENGPDPNEPYGGIKHLFRLLPMLGVIGHSAPHAPHQVPGSTTVGTYAGRKSATADLKALAKAKRMEKAGANAGPGGETRSSTGWFKDPAGDWQYEISDLDSAVLPHPTRPDEYELHHPLLIEAYPQVADIPIHKLSPDVDHLGFYGTSSGKPEVGIRGGMTPEELRSVGLHEIGGHAVQDIEGFARGSSPERAGPRRDEAMQVVDELGDWDRLKPYIDFAQGDVAQAVAMFNGHKPNGTTFHRHYVERLNDIYGKKTPEDLQALRDRHGPWASTTGPHDAYQKNLGEFAARDIQARADLNDWAREDVLPYSSERTPPGGWIDNRGSGGKAMAVDPPGPGGEAPFVPTSLDEAVAPTGSPGGSAPGAKGDIADPGPSPVPAPDQSGGLSTFQQPVTYQGKDLSQWTDQDFAAFGREHGVDNLGPLTPPETVRDQAGREIRIPGGFEGKFTYYDLLDLKAQGINADTLDPALHTKLAQKLGRTMTPENLAPEHIFNGILFGITSPNQPLLPNQMAASRLKVGSMEDIGRIADMIPWRHGDQVPKDVRKQYDSKIAENFGLQAGSAGGLGIKGSQDYTRIAELAQMFRENPDWFRLKPGEAWADYVDRLSSQVTGLGTKTGSFSSVWQNPAGAQVSAMDRHMAQRMFEELFPAKSPERKDIEKALATRWNDKVQTRRSLEHQLKKKEITPAEFDRKTTYLGVGTDSKMVRGLQGILGQSGGDGFFTGYMLEQMGAGEKKLNMAKGGRNPSLSLGLQQTDWIREPEYVKTASPLYRQALDVNAADAAQQGLSLFMSQWRGWDRQRKRLEPHENMFPGLELLPRPSNDQLRAALKAHTQTGHLDYTKENQLNAKGELEARLRPTRPTDNPASLAFFSAAPVPKGSQEDPARAAAIAAWLRAGGM